MCTHMHTHTASIGGTPSKSRTCISVSRDAFNKQTASLGLGICSTNKMHLLSRYAFNKQKHLWSRDVLNRQSPIFHPSIQ